MLIEKNCDKQQERLGLPDNNANDEKGSLKLTHLVAMVVIVFHLISILLSFSHSATCGVGITMRTRTFIDRVGRKKCPHITVGMSAM